MNKNLKTRKYLALALLPILCLSFLWVGYSVGIGATPNYPDYYLDQSTADYSYKICTDGDGWYWAVNGSNGAVCWTSTNATSVFQNALNLGGKIIVGNGTYTITNTLTMKISGTKLEGQHYSAFSNGAVANYGSVLKLANNADCNLISVDGTGSSLANGMTDGAIRGLLLNGNTANQGVSSVSHLISITNATSFDVSDCLLNYAHDSAVMINGTTATGSSIYLINIHNNQIYANGQPVGITCVTGAQIHAINIKDNYFYSTGLSIYPVGTGSCNEISVKNNFFSNMIAYGIVFTGNGVDNEFSGNTVLNPTSSAMFIGCWNSMISQNTISSGSSDGIDVTAGPNMIQGNIVTGNAAYQIKIISGANNTVQGNIVTGGTGIVVMAGVTGTHVRDNNLDGCTVKQIIDNGTTSDIPSYNYLQGVVPTAATWDVNPTDLANSTDSNFATTTGNGNKAITGTANFGALTWTLPAGNYEISGSAMIGFSGAVGYIVMTVDGQNVGAGNFGSVVMTWASGYPVCNFGPIFVHVTSNISLVWQGTSTGTWYGSVYEIRAYQVP